MGANLCPIAVFVTVLNTSCSSGIFVTNYRYSVQSGRLKTRGIYVLKKFFSTVGNVLQCKR